MNRIVHLALKVENLERATEFYETVKFRAPDGIVAEIVPAERYKKAKRSRR